MANSGEQFSTPVPLTAHRYRHLHHGTDGRGADLLPKTPVAGSVAKVTFNDDEAERRQRRLHSNLCTMLSPGCHTPKSAARSSTKKGNSTVESVTSSLTNNQLKDHYANCIKLSSQNKINSKNAFGLHLIDHMLQLLTVRGEMTNFQVASSTLDASAKIYAGRVDSIYTDAFKVLTSFGREGQGTDQTDGEPSAETEGEQTKTKTKKTTPTVNKVIEKNVKNLNINTFDLEYEVDPLFKKTSAAFDEGGVEGMLVNHLHTGDCYLLSLDADEVPSYKDHPVTDVNVDLADMRKLISVEAVSSRQLCPTFSSLFTEEGGRDGWDIGQATTTLDSRSNNQDSDIGAEYSMLPCPPGGADFTIHDDDDGADMGPMGDTEMSPTQGSVDLTVLGTGSDIKMAGFISTAGLLSTGDKPEGDAPLCLSEAIQTSDYSYFAPSILATWAGPKHWKIHAKTTENTDKEDKRTKRKRQPPTQFKIDFNETPDETSLTKGKGSVKLSKQVLTRRKSAQTTLPEDPHTKIDVLHKLFSRPKWEVRRRRGKVESVDDRLEGDWYDYGNPHDNINYCPQVHDDSDGDIDGGDGFPLSQDTGVDFYSQSQDREPDTDFALTGDNLVPQPRKVQPIQIDYARSAKKLDIKKLKNRMWELLHPAVDDPDSEVSDESSKSTFSTLCSTLPSQLTNEMKKNISVPICFVCLLHLANEKGLDITTGDANLSDLEIATT